MEKREDSVEILQIELINYYWADGIKFRKRVFESHETPKNYCWRNLRFPKDNLFKVTSIGDFDRRIFAINTPENEAKMLKLLAEEYGKMHDKVIECIKMLDIADKVEPQYHEEG